MPAKTLEESVALNGKRSVNAATEQYAKRLQAAKPQAAARENPFFVEGGKAPKVIGLPGQKLINLLVERKLHKDPELLAAIEDAVRAGANSAMFGFFAGIDGEGDWKGDRAYVCSEGGVKCSPVLHEMFGGLADSGKES